MDAGNFVPRACRCEFCGRPANVQDAGTTICSVCTFGALMRQGVVRLDYGSRKPTTLGVACEHMRRHEPEVIEVRS